MNDKTLVERIVARQMVAGDIHAGTYADMNNQIEALQARVDVLEAVLRECSRKSDEPTTIEMIVEQALEGSGND